MVTVLLSSCATPFGGHTAATPENSVELDKAVYEVEDAIRYYQTYLRSQTRGLPRLSKVEFEFQTTSAVGGGLSASVYVFTLGASAQRAVTHDVTYTYPRLPSTGEKHDKTPPYLFNELTDTIKTTVDAANAAKNFGTQPYNSLQVRVQYAFSKSLKGGANFPVEMVTLGINAQADKNSIQSVTLTFAPH
jgi:hypothetical protein